jgi:hypothetical protein
LVADWPIYWPPGGRLEQVPAAAVVLRRNENIDDDLSGLAKPTSAHHAYRDASFAVYNPPISRKAAA